MPPFPWHDAKQTLLRISRAELQSFFQSDRSQDVYGVGFFCHNSYGDVLLVANTADYHRASFQGYVEQFGICNEIEYKWNIGNWQYPAGIAAGPNQQSPEYSRSWAPYQKIIDEMTMSEAVDHAGDQLRNLCCEVLQSLISEGLFDARLPHLGFTVMDVDDPDSVGPETMKRFDEYARNR